MPACAVPPAAFQSWLPPCACLPACLPARPPAEDDESLTADEKALLRFQKQRLREMSGGKFSLPDDDGGGGGGGGGGPEDQLTHMGRSLAELEDLQEVCCIAMYCSAPLCIALHVFDLAFPKADTINRHLLAG